MSNLADLSLLDVVAAIQSGEPSAAEVLAACLVRFDAHEGPVNATIRIDREGAVAAAAAAEGAYAHAGLNMAEFAQNGTGHNRHFGHCKNPWRLPYIIGGSSSVSGAAVASRFTCAALAGMAARLEARARSEREDEHGDSPVNGPAATLSLEVVVQHVAGLKYRDLDRRVANAWVLPDRPAGHYGFRDIDVAPVALIKRLRDEMDANEQALPVILSLLDLI